MSFFSDLWNTIKKFFNGELRKADDIAIVVTEGIKTALSSGAAGFLATVIDSLAKSNVAEDVLKLIKTYLPKVLATELALKGLPENPTEDDILAFEQDILQAFGVTSNSSKLYTTLAAQVYGEIKNTVESTPGKFADWVAAVEAAYQDYIALKNADPAE